MTQQTFRKHIFLCFSDFFVFVYNNPEALSIGGFLENDVLYTYYMHIYDMTFRLFCCYNLMFFCVVVMVCIGPLKPLIMCCFSLKIEFCLFARVR